VEQRKQRKKSNAVEKKSYGVRFITKNLKEVKGKKSSANRMPFWKAVGPTPRVMRWELKHAHID